MKETTLSGNMPKRNLVVEIIASLLLVFITHTLVSSYIQLQSLKNVLAFYTSNTATVAWSILITETITVALIFFPRTRLIGLIATFLMVSFAGITILQHPHFPHHFGGIVNHLSSSKQILIYSLLLVLSTAGIFLLLKKRKIKIETESQPVVFT